MYNIVPRTLNLAGAQMAHAARGAAMRFPWENTLAFAGSPYENKRPPNGGLLFWQGHKGLARRMAPLCVFRGKTRSPLRDPHTKTKDHRMVVFYFGRGTKARTLDTRFWRPLLYQLSYTPIGAGLIPRCALAANQAMLERVTGIEPARPAWKAGILPLNYTRRINA